MDTLESEDYPRDASDFSAPHNLSSMIYSDLMFMILFLMEEEEPGLRAFVKKSA